METSSHILLLNRVLRYNFFLINNPRAFSISIRTLIRSEKTGMEQSNTDQGRAIAQAVGRWLPNAAAQVRARVWSCGICGGQCGARSGFLRVLRFPLPIFIPLIASQSPSSIIWGLYNRPEMAAVPRDLPPHQTQTQRTVALVTCPSPDAVNT
jgi:hypothetical protein